MLRHSLGSDIGQKSSKCGLDRGQIFQLIRTALQRQKLYVEVIGRVRFAQWRLPDGHHQRHQKAIEIVVLLANDADQSSETAAFLRCQVGERARMPPGVNHNLGRKARGERHEGDKVMVPRDDPRSRSSTLLPEPAEQTGSGILLGVTLAGRQFCLCVRRDEWHGVNLSMRMRHGHARRLPRSFQTRRRTRCRDWRCAAWCALSRGRRSYPSSRLSIAKEAACARANTTPRRRPREDRHSKQAFVRNKGIGLGRECRKVVWVQVDVVVSGTFPDPGSKGHQLAGICGLF